MELNPIVKEALVNIDFIERYQRLSNEFSDEKIPSEKRLVNVDKTEVFRILNKLGYEASYDSRERFFKIKEERIGKYSFGFYMILRGYADLIWVIREDDQVLLGAPWGTYSKRMLDPEQKIKHPFYGTYDDLEQILTTAFEMYKDFKKAIIDLQSELVQILIRT